MSTDHRRAANLLQQVLQGHSAAELSPQLAPFNDAVTLRVPGGARAGNDAVEQRWGLLATSAAERDALCDAQTIAHADCYANNIENFIGTVKVPVGIAGPLRVNGLYANGDYVVPLATTEAALVASYSRGAQLVSEAGGCAAMLLNESVSRVPGFAFSNLQEVGTFVAWVVPHVDELRLVAESTTRHGKLLDMRVTVEGSHVYLHFEYSTGDAAGQNMVTIATQAICDYIQEHSPVAASACYVEANMSGDKKASLQSFVSVRGKKVTAEVCLSPQLIHKYLHTTPREMENYWRMAAIGGVLSGTLGIQGHYANGLAALYIACGQDAACVAECAVGVTRFETTADGDLYAAVTLPNLLVGTVGGGTALPSQRACLEIMGLAGEGKARAFAEICAALVLAGELSIIGALASGEFTRAHQRLARTRRSVTTDSAIRATDEK
jgi:hydroxymethylglutaryl-CoA reductase (NADPH)